MSIEHPIITKMERDGYLEEDITTTDYFGNEVAPGDEIVADDEGDFVIKEKLKDFLIDKYGFRFGEYGD